MSKGWSYKSGDWNILCDVCAVKTKASKTKERWDGFRVCPECFETRHSMDFIKARADKISVPFTRPQPTDQFVSNSLGYYPADFMTMTGGALESGYFLTDYIDPTYFATSSTIYEISIVVNEEAYIDLTYFLDTFDYIGNPGTTYNT